MIRKMDDQVVSSSLFFRPWYVAVHVSSSWSFDTKNVLKERVAPRVDSLFNIALKSDAYFSMYKVEAAFVTHTYMIEKHHSQS